MELLYIWIKNCRNLQNIGFNFSNEFRFQYDYLSQELAISLVENYTPNFFGSNITHFTSLIGENGTGKTTVLRFIIDNYIDGIAKDDVEDSVIVFRSGGKIGYHHSKEVIVKEHISVRNLKPLKLPNRPTFKIVYHSQLFDAIAISKGGTLSSEFSGLENISETVMFWKDVERRENYTRSYAQVKELAQSFHYSELNRISKLSKKYLNNGSLPVTFPSFFTVRASTYDKRHLNHNYQSLEATFRQLQERFGGAYILSRSTRKELIVFRFFEAAIYNIIRRPSQTNFPRAHINNALRQAIVSGSQRYFLKASNTDLNEVERLLLLLKYIIQRLENYLLKLEKTSKLESEKAWTDFAVKKDQFQYLLRSFGVIEGLVNFINDDNQLPERNGFYIDISNAEIHNRFQILLQNWYRVEGITSWLDVRMSHNAYQDSDFSSGERTFFALFSRLNWLVERSASPFRSSHMLLMLDEAELALHPRWQQRFIDVLTKLIGNVLNGIKVQIILTSHSPFIVADMPSHALLFLRRQDGRTSVVEDGLEYHHTTFGANIHRLFTENFFLDKHLMGDFAKEEIDKLIKEISAAHEIAVIKQQELSQEFDALTIRKKVNLIAEPFIRDQLLTKLAEITNDEVFYTDMIKRKEEEIRSINALRLKRGKNDQNIG